MVREHKRLAQNRLPIPVWNSREKVNLRIAYQLSHLRQIALKRFHARLPCGNTRRHLCFWPITLRKFWRDMFRIPRKLKDVPLRDPKMLQQLPGRVGSARRFCAAHRFWNACQNVFPAGVRIPFTEQIGKLPSQRAVIASRLWSFRCRLFLRSGLFPLRGLVFSRPLHISILGRCAHRVNPAAGPSIWSHRLHVALCGRIIPQRILRRVRWMRILRRIN